MALSFAALFLLTALAGSWYTAALEKVTRWQPYGVFPPMQNKMFPRVPGSLRPMTNRDVLFGHTPGNCTTILETGSPEDIIVMPGGKAIMSTGYFTNDLGRMWHMDLNNPGNGMHEFGIEGHPRRKDFIPLGTSLWTDPKSGKTILIVSNHDRSGHKCIDFFEMKSSVLKYIRSIPIQDYVRGLLMVDKDRFYMVRLSTSSDPRVHVSESRSGKGSGGLLYFDGKRTHEIYKGLILPITMRASKDGRYLYLTEWGGSSVHVFERDPKNDLNLKPIQTVYTGTGVDLINICPETGDLWLGAHPNGFVLNEWILGKKIKAPSQVLRMTIDHTCGKVDDITEVYADSGESLIASTFGVVHQNTLYIGSMGNKFVKCDSTCVGK